jgi:alanyl-tRNA synthetase
MDSERLYQADSWLDTFEAVVVRHAELGNRRTVILDRTAFYPESGGQMADRGRIGDVAIVDVQADDTGAIHHVLDGELPAPGATVRGTVDRARRRVHMALHTGQHILSRALELEAKSATVSARLGETACTIDVDRGAVPEAEIARAEDLANAVVDDDLDVRAWFPDPGELATLALRREAKVAGPVRVVRVGDFDVTPCGGTHCRRSAEVGLLGIAGVERYKGGLRITFTAGKRARDELGAQARMLRALGRSLSCPPLGVAAALERLQGDLGSARASVKRLQSELAATLAVTLAAQGSRVVASLPDAAPDLLREIGLRLVAEPDRVIFLAGSSSEGLSVLVARGGAATFDCGGFVKRVAAATGGRGGGKPDRAEGRLPAGTDWLALVASGEP